MAAPNSAFNNSPITIAEAPVPAGRNLLRVRAVRALVVWPGFPYLFQGVLFAALIALAASAWAVHAPPGVNAKLFAKANLVTLVVWGLWWPSMVWAAVLFGRVWCAVCPLELVSNVSERAGRAFGLRQRSLRGWLATGGLVAALYGCSQMLVMGADLHRVPAFTSLFIFGLVALAAVTGVFLKNRAFCAGFCPVGLLLGTYGRGGMLAVRPGSSAVCRACRDKACVRAANRTRLDARSCPSLLNPQSLADNADCLYCGQCMKVCAPDNMQWLLRRPFHADDARPGMAPWPVTVFVMLASGFVMSELLTEWPAAEHVFLSPALAAAGLVGPPSVAGWCEGVWTLAVVPAVLWLMLGGLMIAFGERGMSAAWTRLALPLAVVVSAGHMTKGLAKIASWAPFLAQSLRDPGGAATAAAISARTLAAPAPWMPLAWVSVVGLALVGMAGVFAVREYRLAGSGESSPLAGGASVFILTGIYAAIIAGWAFQ